VDFCQVFLIPLKDVTVTLGWFSYLFFADERIVIIISSECTRLEVEEKVGLDASHPVQGEGGGRRGTMLDVVCPSCCT
jgi:hypothetical protein